MDQASTDKRAFFDSVLQISAVLEDLLDSYVQVSAGPAMGQLINILNSTLSKGGVKPI